jgi:hypothetical protein
LTIEKRMSQRRLIQALRSRRSGRLLIALARLAIDVLHSPSLAVLLATLFAERQMRGRHRRYAVAFYPRLPHHRYMIWKTLKYMRAEIVACTDTSSASAADRLYIAWHDGTFVDPGVDDWLPTESRGAMLNGRLYDISKRHVETVFTEVFGYGLAVNPTEYHGICVEKSNLNGQHDGLTISCPIKLAKPDKIYQKLIDNSTEDGYVMDIRTPVIKGHIPYVYLKYRPKQSRFSNVNAKVSMISVEHVFAKKERYVIAEFCKKIGLDIGELDILRNNGDGKIYIIDVNNTPYGPPNHLSISDSIQAIRHYAYAMATTFESSAQDACSRG